MIVTISALKLDVSYLKWFADLGPDQHAELLSTMLFAGLVTSLCGGTALYLLLTSHYGALWLHNSSRSFAWMLVPIVVSENLQVLLLTNLRARRKAVSYSASAIIRLICIVTASYYLLVARRMGLPGLFLGRLVGDAAATVFLLALSLRAIVFKISLRLIRPMLRFGYPLIWSVFAVQLQDAAGRYVLSRYGGMDQVGLLGAAIKISAVFQTLINVPFGIAWGGVLFQIAKERDAKMIYSKVLGYVCFSALGAALIITTFAPTLFRIFATPAYYSAIAIFPFIVLVRAISAIEQPAATGLYLSGRTGSLAAAYTIALLLEVVLLLQLVPKYGAVGMVWAWLIGSATVPIFFLAVGQRLYRLNINWELLFLSIFPWCFAFVVCSQKLFRDALRHIIVQAAVASTIALYMGYMIVRDCRKLQRRLQATGASETEWEGIAK
jgi:O-antigen/teichoic acid export membrane protein